MEDKWAELREVIQGGVNSPNSDGQWAALTDAARILGLEYDEDSDQYV